MTLVLAGTLLALALVDSLSAGTLLIPLFFLLAPGRVPAGRLLVYLVTIAGFYFLVGLAVLLGAATIFRDFGALLETPAAYSVQLVIGVALFTLSFWIGRKRPEGETAAPGRVSRWRDRALSPDGSARALVALALGAGVVELATMLPYIGAIGLLTTSDVDVPVRILVLAGYCLVMIAPAIVVLVARVVAGRLIQPTLDRFAGWMQRNAAENTAWIVGLVGFFLASNAVSTLGLFSEGSPITFG